MLNLIDIDKTQLSEPAVAFLNAMELKHAINPTTFDVKVLLNTGRPEFYQFRFFDPRFTEEEMPPVGVAEWTYGTRNYKEYKVASRNITNARYGYWGSENSARRTKDVKKAIKIAIESLAPYEWHEVSAKGRKNAEDSHRNWTHENSEALDPFRMNIDQIFKEIKHLVEQGVVFKTEAFKKAAAGIPAYEEYEGRLNKNAKFHTVIERGEKIIYIRDNNALKAEEFNAIDSLPEATRNAMALLKLVGGNKLLPEVGYREGENTYFIYA